MTIDRHILADAGFSDPTGAERALHRLAQAAGDGVLEAALPYLLACLSAAPDPDHVLLNLERLAGGRADPGALFRYLAETPRAVDVLVALFSGSQFLSEILLRHPEAVEQVVEETLRAQPKDAAQIFTELTQVLQAIADPAAMLDELRHYQRHEMLRIGACDLLGLYDLPAVTAQLSHLADGLVRACLGIAGWQAGLSGSPLETPDGFAVLAMGKLGGRELNYSSDIDLLFVAAEDRPQFGRLAQKLIEGLTSITGQGFLYRVDVRLRPWGRVGALVTSVAGYLGYLRQSARLWEKQALLKARRVAGDQSVSAEFLRLAAPYLYAETLDTVRAAVHAMKLRTESHLRQNGRDWGEVKLGEGSIRDVEFVAQALQMAHGARQPGVRSRNTLRALDRLFRYRILTVDDHRVLADGYTFLRTIEHHLQMMHYRQTYTLPKDPRALDELARRLGFGGPEVGGQFVARYQQHVQAVREVYLRVMGVNGASMPAGDLPADPEVRRHIERMDASYEAVFSPLDIHRHAELAARLDDANLVEVEAEALEDGDWRVTIVAFDYPGELALICGLMFVYGLDILDGNVFTYEPLAPVTPGERERQRRKIVDVFTVRPAGAVTDDTWRDYRADLAELLRLTHNGQRQEARVRLLKRAAAALPGLRAEPATLFPIDIEIDNQASPGYTLLRIDSADTPGFLYELTNALAFNNVYIARVEIDSSRQRVHDTLYVTDDRGRKITDPARQRELRAATVLIKHFTHLLPRSSDPESALLHFRQLLGQLFQRPNWPDELASFERGEVLDALAQVLGVSHFLWDDFLRMQYANLFPVVRDVDQLATARTREQLQSELEAVLRPVHAGPPAAGVGAGETPWHAAINAFKDREMFRVDMRHILGHSTEFWQFSQELTDLAEVVVNAVFHLVMEDLRALYGEPLLEDGRPARMAVLALGKFGGCEIGFASDIELMFVYAGNGHTGGPQRISTGEFYEKVVEGFTRAIHARQEGIFEIDLRLRPYGKAGSLAVSLESFRRYFAPGGPAWPYERQALVKLRPVAGDADLGRQVVALRDDYVYTGQPFDVTAMRAMRERQLRHLVKGGTFNPKYSPGGLVDVEYLVQGLQIAHGAENPALRVTNTREALAALAAAGILDAQDYTHLRKAHTFLRWLIDSLRVASGNAKDLVTPPPDSEAFAFLARRLRYQGDTARLREDLAAHSASVQQINRRLLG